MADIVMAGIVMAFMGTESIFSRCALETSDEKQARSARSLDETIIAAIALPNLGP